MSAKKHKPPAAVNEIKSQRHRKPINVTLSDEARAILNRAETNSGLKRAQILEITIRQHVAKDYGNS